MSEFHEEERKRLHKNLEAIIASNRRHEDEPSLSSPTELTKRAHRRMAVAFYLEHCPHPKYELVGPLTRCLDCGAVKRSVKVKGGSSGGPTTEGPWEVPLLVRLL